MARWAAEEAERAAVAEAAAAAALEQAEAQRTDDSVPTLEPSPWGDPIVTIAPPAFHPDELAPAASVSFADVYGGTAHPEPVTPDSYDELTVRRDVSQPVAVPMPEPVAAAARPTPDYSGGFVVSPEIAQPGASEGADMAALLRELSSLNSDSDSETSRNGVAGMSPVGSSNGQQGQTVTRPVQTSDAKGKKKKGFFGR